MKAPPFTTSGSLVTRFARWRSSSTASHIWVMSLKPIAGGSRYARAESGYGRRRSRFEYIGNLEIEMQESSNFEIPDFIPRRSPLSPSASKSTRCSRTDQQRRPDDPRMAYPQDPSPSSLRSRALSQTSHRHSLHRRSAPRASGESLHRLHSP